MINKFSYILAEAAAPAAAVATTTEEWPCTSKVFMFFPQFVVVFVFFLIPVLPSKFFLYLLLPFIVLTLTNLFKVDSVYSRYLALC